MRQLRSIERVDACLQTPRMMTAKRSFSALERVAPVAIQAHPRALQVGIAFAAAAAVATALFPIPAAPLLWSVAVGAIAGLLAAPPIAATAIAGLIIMMVAPGTISSAFFGPGPGAVWQTIALVGGAYVFVAALGNRILNSRAAAGSQFARVLLFGTKQSVM